jgi:hypothetical protein
MEVVYPCCCGLDVHKKSITACVLWAEAKGKSHKEKKRFGTFPHDLLQLADWLEQCGVTHLAMESTGVYWKPVWNILAEQFEVLLVNAFSQLRFQTVGTESKGLGGGQNFVAIRFMGFIYRYLRVRTKPGSVLAPTVRR